MNTLKNDIFHGCWDVVLPLLTNFRISEQNAFNLYEQVMFDLTQLNELDAAKALLHHSSALLQLRREQPERYSRIEERIYGIACTLGQETKCVTKEHREALANNILEDINASKPAPILTLLNQALKWQRHAGALTNDTPSQGEDFAQRRQQSFAVEREHCTIYFGKKSYPECASFSPDCNLIATGSSDGFVEIWCWETGKLNKDPNSPAEENIMMHNDSVLALNYSGKGDMLISGSKDAEIKVWGIRTGKCLRKFERAHAQAITVVSFDRDGGCILSASLNGTVRVHGLKSGQLMKEFFGHVAYVNDVKYSGDGTMILSASSDGTARVWDSKNTNILANWEPPYDVEAEKVVRSIYPLGTEPENCIVCTKDSIHLMSVFGEVVRSFEMHSGPKDGFVACTLSPNSRQVYGLGEDGKVYSFCTKTCQLDFTLEAVDIVPTSLCHHPTKNLLATTSSAGYLRIWK